MVFVMDIAIRRLGATPGALAVAISGDDGPALPGGPDPGLAADVQNLRIRSEDDARDRAVAGDHSDCGDIDDVPVDGLVDPAGHAPQRFQIGEEVDVRLVSPHLRSGAGLSWRTGEEFPEETPYGSSAARDAAS